MTKFWGADPSDGFLRKRATRRWSAAPRLIAALRRCYLAVISMQRPKARQALLSEGAQERACRVDHGTYPYRPRATAIAGTAGLPGQVSGRRWWHYVLGITKAYIPRAWVGRFPTELDQRIGELLRKRGTNSAATRAGRGAAAGSTPAALRRSIQINRGFGLCITKLDVLDGMEEGSFARYRMADSSRAAAGPGPRTRPALRAGLTKSFRAGRQHRGRGEYDKLPARSAAYSERLPIGLPGAIELIPTERTGTRHRPAPPFHDFRSGPAPQRQKGPLPLKKHNG